MTTSYQKAHHNIYLARGKASDHPCISCGGRAKDWAYQYPEEVAPLTDPDGRPYSLNVMDYAPMCFGCHITHDRAKEKRLRDVVAENARRSSRALAERRKTDSVLDEKMKAASRRNLDMGRSPEQAHKAALAGGAATARRWREDPELAGRMREISSANGSAVAALMNQMTVSCSDCGMSSRPGPMTRHFNASGHKRKA